MMTAIRKFLTHEATGLQHVALLILWVVWMFALFGCTAKKTVVTNTVTKTDTVTVTKYVRDTIKVFEADTSYAANDILSSVDTMTIDSLELQLALKDARIASLAAQLAAGTLNLKPITAENASSTAIAGVRNNDLYLYLLQKPTDITIDIPTTTTTINTSTDNSTIETKVVKEAWYKNVWLWTSLFMALIMLLMLRSMLRNKSA